MCTNEKKRYGELTEFSFINKKDSKGIPWNNDDDDVVVDDDEMK